VGVKKQKKTWGIIPEPKNKQLKTTEGGERSTIQVRVKGGTGDDAKKSTRSQKWWVSR